MNIIKKQMNILNENNDYFNDASVYSNQIFILTLFVLFKHYYIILSITKKKLTKIFKLLLNVKLLFINVITKIAYCNYIKI